MGGQSVAIKQENDLKASADIHRLAEMGRLSASLLHEISTPLTAAMLHLEQDLDNQANKKALKNILILQRYVETARQQLRQESQAEFFYIRNIVGHIRRLLGPVSVRAGVRLTFDIGANYKIYGDPIIFQQILTNVVLNAIQSYENLPDSDTRPNKVTVIISSKNEWIVVRVTDHGIGIKNSETPKIFDPFYSSKTSNGLGLGLAIVKDYVENYFSGNITAKSGPTSTTFTIKVRALPILHKARRSSESAGA